MLARVSEDDGWSVEAPVAWPVDPPLDEEDPGPDVPLAGAVVAALSLSDGVGLPDALPVVLGLLLPLREALLPVDPCVVEGVSVASSLSEGDAVVVSADESDGEALTIDGTPACAVVLARPHALEAKTSPPAETTTNPATVAARRPASALLSLLRIATPTSPTTKTTGCTRRMHDHTCSPYPKIPPLAVAAEAARQEPAADRISLRCVRESLRSAAVWAERRRVALGHRSIWTTRLSG